MEQKMRPRNLFRRNSFDENWRFTRGDAPGAEQIGFEDSDWSVVHLPHDWSIAGPFSKDHPSGGGGGYLPGGIGWYRKTFEWAQAEQNKTVRIEFDGVYKNCNVWINSHHLGFHPYGYTSFAYELTPYLLPGKNVLAVRVDNSQQPDTRWYSGSGIYRHTWLVITGLLHVAHWGTYVTTPAVSETSAMVSVRTRLRNAGERERTCKLLTEILDAEGQVVASNVVSHPVAPGREHEATQSIRVSQPYLWSLDEPYLYRVRNTLHAGDEVMDVYETPLGIREISFDAALGFLLNGQQVKINGVCLHHDGGCVGAAVPERLWERRFEILKVMGCNGIRTSHYPPAPEFLDLCDRMGFLVMDESFDEWKRGKFPYGYHEYFDDWAVMDLKSMIHRDRNHPSVVIWSVGNEIPEQVTPDGVEILKKLVDIVHQEDPTRPVTSGCDNIAAHIPATQAFLELLDVVGYNYAGRWEDRREKYYSIDHHQFPQWKMIGTENISIPGIRGEYSLEKGQGWWGAYPTSSITAEQLWRFTRIHDYVAGDFMWTGIDYLGETSWPHKSASFGVLDTCGFPKDGYYFYQSQWTVKSMVYLFPHWNWEGQEGRVIPVLCFTNCDEVELFLNGKSFGVKSYVFPARGLDVTKSWGEQDFRGMRHPTTGDLHLSWDVPYEPGTLRAVGKKDGEVVCVHEVVTAGAAAQLELTADREVITADGRDVVHLTVQVLDAAGQRVPKADNLVSFDIAGEGSLIGVDNGDPASHESFQAPERKAFNGLCLAIVKSTAKPGEIQVKVTSPGLEEKSVVVKTMRA
jgi:beta-galactosidase